MSEHIKVTAVLGGRQSGGVCSILEIGETKLLLDCGCSAPAIKGGGNDIDGSQPERLTTDSDRILEAIKKCGGIDAIIISHADIHHMGSLPMILGKKSPFIDHDINGSTDTKIIPVICTWPVFKFGQMFLYDLFLNWQMEGLMNNVNNVTSGVDFDLDDIDLAFSHVHNVKYCQNLCLESITHNSRHHVYLCAYPTGRTIGGSMWKIRHGACEVVYAMDINLRKEVVLEGADINCLPSAPALMIVEGGISYEQESSLHPNNNSNNIHSGQLKRFKSKNDRTDECMSKLITLVMKSLRDGANVLIPCETSSQLFELLQAFSRYWVDHKLGLYNLVFLSHMSYNILEFAKSQLEWMNDSLSKPFFNARAGNPFELPPLKLCSTVREMERQYLGPKVVFATDASLTCGLSKEVLLRWGGDPRCKVIFLDSADEGTLASEILRQMQMNNNNNPAASASSSAAAAPVIVTVTKPQKVELIGEELEVFNLEKERVQRAKDEEIQRILLENEFALLNADRDLYGEEDDSSSGSDSDDDDNDNTTKVRTADESFEEAATGTGTTAGAAIAATTNKKAKLSLGFTSNSNSNNNNNNNNTGRPGRVIRFSEPLFPMLQTRDHVWIVDDYGVLNDDLQFHDIVPSYLSKRSTLFQPHPQPHPQPLTQPLLQPHTLPQPSIIGKSVPFKTTAVKTRIQLTCELIEFSRLNYRADVKSIKSFVSKINPARVVVLRGQEKDCEAMVSFSQSRGIEAYAPRNSQSVSFNVRADKLRIQISQQFLPSNMKAIKGCNAAGEETTCFVSAVAGFLQESADSGRDGMRMVELLQVASHGDSEPDSEVIVSLEDRHGDRDSDDRDGTVVTTTVTAAVHTTDAAVVSSNGFYEQQQQQQQEKEEEEEEEEEEKVEQPAVVKRIDADASLHWPRLIGAISVGEVKLINLKQLIEQLGISVEYVTGVTGGMLLCGSQVVIRRDDDNNDDFVIEGPPTPTYYLARKALYQHFAFV